MMTIGVRNRGISAALAVAAALWASAGQAATLGSVQGDVLVNKGAGYSRASGGALKPGDTVMAKAGGSAQISYDDGCVVEVKVGSVVTVAQESPCKPVGALPAAAGLGGVGVAAGVAVIGAGVAVAVVANRKKSHPASP